MVFSNIDIWLTPFPLLDNVFCHKLGNNINTKIGFLFKPDIILYTYGRIEDRARFKQNCIAFGWPRKVTSQWHEIIDQKLWYCIFFIELRLLTHWSVMYRTMVEKISRNQVGWFNLCGPLQPLIRFNQPRKSSTSNSNQGGFP